MAERRKIIHSESIEYEGLFSITEVSKLIKEWMSDKGYVPIESKVSESISKKGKSIEIVYEPYKKLTDYAKSAVKIQVTAEDITETEVKKDKTKKKLNKGKLSITFDAWIETDYEHKWEARPLFYFLRTIYEKYVYTPYLSGFANQIKEDVLMLKENVKAYLNLYKY